MDRTIVWLAPAAAPDPDERALLEIDAAIALVSGGAAVRVRVCGQPAAEDVAVAGAARAQAAHVAFQLRREPSGSVTVVVGPRLDVRPAGLR
ncbi:MAG: hypothetical protein H0U52_08105 [Chloroflexi bacterium]|nr:hypothetical protein [Chloroflexota bacterium]